MLLFTATIDALESDTEPYKKRLAVLWAAEENKSLVNADLYGANLSGLDLSDLKFYFADLRLADLRGAKIIISDFFGPTTSAPKLDGAIF
jgi:uncharacterized protein YjbI with pentapeptide repeats